MIKKQINIDISEIKPYNKNNKKHWNNINEIVKSIQANGYITPILLDEDNVILAWHWRYEAIKRLEMKKIDVIQVAWLSDKQKRDFRIRDNKLAELSEWDFENLKFELDDLNIPDLSDLFKDEEEMQWEEQTAEEDDYVVPDEITTDIVIWDLFEIGEHRLLCGDSTDSDQVANLMNGQKYDLIVTDPPYNVAYEGKTKDALTIKNDKMKSSDFVQFLTDYFSTTLINTKKGGCIYVFFADMELRSFVDAFLDGGFKLSQQLIWLKQTMVMGRKDYHCKHEPILYGWYEGEAHNWYSDRKQTTILEFDRPQRNGEHPTMKPIKLIEYLINNSSKQGDLLGDGFLGSGSTMVASHQLKRKCYGMELDTKYCQVIIDRMYKLDPSLTFKKNWQPYNPETKDLILFDK